MIIWFHKDFSFDGIHLEEIHFAATWRVSADDQFARIFAISHAKDCSTLKIMSCNNGQSSN